VSGGVRSLWHFPQLVLLLALGRVRLPPGRDGAVDGDDGGERGREHGVQFAIEGARRRGTGGGVHAGDAHGYDDCGRADLLVLVRVGEQRGEREVRGLQVLGVRGVRGVLGGLGVLVLGVLVGQDSQRRVD
jgi:hypothetical protein